MGMDSGSFSYLSFPLKMIKLLQSFNIRPICVFDGMHLNAKAVTERCRVEQKLKNKKKGEQLDKQGNHEEAKRHFGKAMQISSKMIDLFIEILQKLNIELIISPYEADAQISYLCKSGLADFGVSEDSDIVVFGCPVLVSKLQPSGDCSVVKINDLWDKEESKKIKDKSLSELCKFDHNVFIRICVMAGCDYLPSMERMGLKTGIKHFTKHKTFKGIMNHLKSHKKFKDRIPPNYEDAVEKVHDLFLYQTIYDPIANTCKPLNPLPPNYEPDQVFLGEYIESDKLDKYVKGHLNKYTLEDREMFDPDIKRIKMDMEGNDINLQTFYYLHQKYDFSKKKENPEDDEDKKIDDGHKGTKIV